MSEFNYNKNFIREKLSREKNNNNTFKFEELLNDVIDINTQILMRKRQYEQAKIKSEPNFFNPYIVQKKDPESYELSNLDDWNVFLKKKLSSSWFPFNQDGQITQKTHPNSILFEENLGPYQEGDANKVLEVLEERVINIVLDKIKTSDLVKSKEADIHIKEYNDKRMLDSKEAFADIFNKIGLCNLQKDYVLSDNLIEEYASLIDLEKEFVNNSFSFYIDRNFGMFIHKRTRSLRWFHNINNIIKSLKNVSFTLCNKDLALRIENSNSGMYKRNSNRSPYMTNQKMGTINKGGVDLYSLSSVNSSSIMYFKTGKSNIFDVKIKNVAELRPNEYYFSINLLIDFDNILKFIIFD